MEPVEGERVGSTLFTHDGYLYRRDKQGLNGKLLDLFRATFFCL